MKRKRILYLSGWKVFDRTTIQVPFIYEQVGFLSEDVIAVYVDFYFLSFFQWIWNVITGRWITESENPWLSDHFKVSYLRIAIPKFPTPVTRNSLWQDFYFAGRYFGPMILRRIGPIDLIHVHVVLPVGALAMGIKKRLGIPFLIQEHSGPFSMHCRTALQVKGVKQVLEACDKVLPVSEALKQEMLKYYPIGEKFGVIPNLVRTDIFKPCVEKEAFGSQQEIRIVSVCSRQKVKRHDLMFAIVKELSGRGFVVRLNLFGVDESAVELVKLRDEMGLGNHVFFKGKVSKGVLHSAFCKHDVYLCTSDVETFGLAPAEAISSGLPVVSSDCGGIHEFMDQRNGIIVSEQNPAMFADAILATYRNAAFNNIHSFEKINAVYGTSGFKKRISEIYSNM